MTDSRVALINDLHSQLGGLYGVSEKPTCLEEYQEEIDRLTLMAQLAGRLAAEAWEEKRDREYHAADFHAALRERSMREADLYGVQNHHLDGKHR